MKALIFTEDEFRAILKEERAAMLSELQEAFKSNVKAAYKRLNAKEAAGFLGISMSTLYKRVSQLPHKKFGKKLTFSAEELRNVTV